MIGQIMAACNNHFWRSRERRLFKIVSDGITGSFTETYIAGQYIHVVGSFINDGVYKIVSATSSKITVDATLQAENTGEYITVYGCKAPSDFLALVSDIETWTASNGDKSGIASESIDGYSISFASNPDGTVGNTWQNAFKTRLTQYRQMYESWCDYGYK